MNTGQILKAADSQCEQSIEGHKLNFSEAWPLQIGTGRSDEMVAYVFVTAAICMGSPFVLFCGYLPDDPWLTLVELCGLLPLIGISFGQKLVECNPRRTDGMLPLHMITQNHWRQRSHCSGVRSVLVCLSVCLFVW